MTEAIAERRFEWADRSGCIEVRLYPPSKRACGYTCRFELGGRTLVVHEVYGFDSLQALRLAIEGIRFFLEPVMGELRLAGEPWLDLPRSVPSGFGESIDARFQRAVDAEMERLSESHGENLEDLKEKERANLRTRRQELLAALK